MGGIRGPCSKVIQPSFPIYDTPCQPPFSYMYQRILLFFQVEGEAEWDLIERPEVPTPEQQDDVSHWALALQLDE